MEPNDRPIFQCANPGCRADLGRDHVTLITTCHLRRFCSVECITEGHQLVLDEIASEWSRE